MSRYTAMGDYVEKLPQAFTNVHSFRPMGAYTALGSNGTPKSAPDVKDPEKASKIVETTQMLNDITPLIESLGAMGVAFGPIITGLIETAGVASVPMVNALPLPASFKKSFAEMAGKAEKAGKDLGNQSAAEEAEEEKEKEEDGLPLPWIIGGSVATLGLVAFLAMRKRT